jgi:hypothetical protein
MKITKFASTMLLSTSLIVGQLQAAPAIDPERQPLGTIGPIELSNNDLSVGGVTAYRGWFENGSWQGDVIQYDVSINGQLTTTIDTSGYTPTQGAAKADGTFNWSAFLKMESLHADFWKNPASIWPARKIITRNSDTGAQVAFRWDQISRDQQILLDPVTATDAASSSILDYIRGDQSNEVVNGGGLRTRQNRLGDIIHSNPEYVGAPEDTHTESDYVQFKNDNLGRNARVYVGANDGLLHSLRADNGYSAWSYLPSMLFPKLTRLAGVPYAHRYYVDGGITVRDAKLGSAWRSVLVGSLGAGGKGLYVLDVTDPWLPDEGGVAPEIKLIREVAAYDAVHGVDIGYIFDATTIAKLNDGKWYAVAGNGIASVNGEAKLVLIQLETGNVSLIGTGSGTAADPNGLAAPALLDTDGDGDADIAWAGDVNGDMWRFDLTGTSGWHKDYLLFDGSAAQPITQAPDVTNHPQFGYLVLFGTGKLYEPADVTDTTVQAIYGVWDKGTTVTTGSMLSQQLTGDLIYNEDGVSGAAITPNEVVRNFNPVVPVDYGTYDGGWYINLPGGERVLTPPALRAGRLKSTVTDPDGFSNWFLEATFDDGTATDESIFDLNRDSSLVGNGDRVSGNGDLDLVDPEDIVMGWKRPDGNMSQVTIARLGPGQDTLFLNFLNPPLVEAPKPCSGECTGGLEGGHMDIDTDHALLPGISTVDKDGNDVVIFGDGYGGWTDIHKHEYDITHNRTYIDYFDIDPIPEGKPFPVTAAIADSTREFIVTIANADWSPGGRLTIGDVEYNVVEYQVMLHKALAKWEPDSAAASKNTLEDPAGNTLIHSLDSIRADVDSDGNPGTLRTTFDATALIYGGLVPSKTSCVQGDAASYLASNRWRGNALVMHLVDADYVKDLSAAADTQPLDRLRVQDITDSTFYERIILSDGTMIKLTGDSDNDGVEGDAPEYEVYGGITAKDEASFLYESTAFWHWSDKDGNQLGECWSDSDVYRTAYRDVTTRIAVGIFLDRLAQETVFDTFEQLVVALTDMETLACQNTATVDGGCKEEYDRLRALYEEGMLVFQLPFDSTLPGEEEGYVEGQNGSLTGDPVIIEGGIAEGGLTSGPNFESGRRTWIDILSE